MKSLFSSSSDHTAAAAEGVSGGGGDGDLEMAGGSSSSATSAGGGKYLDKFLEDVERIQDELKEVERLHRSLRESNEAGKSLHDAAAVRSLRARMNADVALALKKANLIKLRILEGGLDRANDDANRSLPGGSGSTTTDDGTRSSVVAGRLGKLKDCIDSFSALRQQVAAEHRDTVGRRYYTVTGETADEATLDAIISTGEAERILMVQRAIQEEVAGRAGQVMAVVREIRERHGAAVELERSLGELQQVFMDMAGLLVAAPDHEQQQLKEDYTNIERQVMMPKAACCAIVVTGCTQQFPTETWEQQNSTCNDWTRVALLLLVIIILALPLLIPKIRG